MCPLGAASPPRRLPLSREERWNAKFEALVAFKEETGHCRVPQKHPVLGTWVNQQRRYCKKKDGSLSAQRAARLEAIGLEISTLEEVFNANFAALVEFQREAGHCSVPRDHPVLGTWVPILRTMYKRDGHTLPGDCVARPELLECAFEPGQGCGADQ